MAKVEAIKRKRISTSDAKGRIVLGPGYANKHFQITVQPNGNLLLEPSVFIHEREAWLYKDPAAMEAVQRGISESNMGRGKSLGSYARYLENDKK